MRCPTADSVAPANPYLGVMLPYTPLHHLLLADLGFPVVATSGNRSDEPICTDEREAVDGCAGWPMSSWCTTGQSPATWTTPSCVWWPGGTWCCGGRAAMRRSRGAPIRRAAVLGVGAHLKNAVALSVGANVFVSQHVGDLETVEAFGAFERVIDAFERLYEASPPVIACDAHPDYLSTAYAKRRGTETRQVQHHLAHVLSAMAENEIEPPALGVSWDGTGFGLDGTIWGGEFIAVSPGSARRVATFRAFPLPGGDRAVREPRRTALALLCEVFGEDAWAMEDLPTIAAFSQAERRILRAMLERGVNSPRTSSVGRLFDAAASIAGLRHHVRFEGQAAMALEFAREGTETDEAYPLAFVDARRPESGDAAAVAGLIRRAALDHRPRAARPRARRQRASPRPRRHDFGALPQRPGRGRRRDRPAVGVPAGRPLRRLLPESVPARADDHPASC